VPVPDFAPDSQLMNVVVRMVVPMRREFGRSLDVQQFLRDEAYAKSVLTDALTSGDARLRDYAKYVSERIAGARVAVAPPAPPRAAAAEPKPTPAAGASEDELRERVMRKYTGGLR
jgi:hypothetical protein